MITYREVAELLAYLSRLNPAMRIVEGQALAWHDQLAEYPAADVMAAARKVGGEQVWVAVADIRAQVKRIRADRLRGVNIHALVQIDQSTDPIAYQLEYRRLTNEVASGIRDARGELEAGS